MSNTSTTPVASSGAVRADVAEKLDRAAVLFASGMTAAQVAAQMDVKPQTVRQWKMDHPALNEAIRALRAEAAEAAYNKLSAEAAAMAEVIMDAATGEDVSALQLRAAETALRIMAQFRDADLEARVAALEAAAREPEGGR